MKLRFNALDIRAEISSLQYLIGNRLANIYDLNTKTFLFKFSVKDDKVLLLVESGIRFHTTQFNREKNMPSGYCMKLRKHLRTRRLTALTQIGYDRAIDMMFGYGDSAYHVIVEFYSSGNIILTGPDYQILSLLRVVELEDQSIRVGQIYQTDNARVFNPISEQHLLNSLLPKGKKKKERTLKNVLRSNLAGEYGPLVDVALKKFEVDPNLEIAVINEDEMAKPAWMSDILLPIDCQDPIFQTLLHGFKYCDEIIEQCKTPQHGSLYSEEKDGLVSYVDFQPFSMIDSNATDFESFDKCVDEYFSKIESQKLQLKAKQAEMNAAKKLETVRQSHQNQILGFEMAIETKQLYAQAIEYNLWLVDSAIQTIRSFVASGMDWGDLWNLIKEEKENGNQIALAIHGLKLEVGQFTLALPNPLEEEDDDDIGSQDETGSENDSQEQAPSKPLLIDIDIYSSAYANATNYYDAKKVAGVKAEKTKVASKKALESAEKKIALDLKENVKQTPIITKIRKPWWFEKFLWFISSENYLVVGGKDASQNELLVKRYMKPGDVYVHADLHGASSVIVKNLPPGQGAPDPNNAIPPSTLLQAGTMSVCQSKAWEAKIVTSAYWVYSHQVSKTAPTGEYLTTGSFMIRGKKNFLPPIQLVYGIGLLFKTDESSIGRHYWERRPWGRDQSLGDDSLNLPNKKYTGSSDLDNEIQAINSSTENISLAEDESNNSLENIANQEEENIKSDQLEKEQSTLSLQETKDNEAASSSSSDSEIEFPDVQIDLNEPQRPIESNDSQPSKKRISAKERRDMKKSGTKKSTTETLAETCSTTSLKDASENATPKTERMSPKVRGKKGKLKKIKEKYADQDEEDRKLMLDLLGSNKGPQPKGKKEKMKAEKLKKQADAKAKDSAQKLEKSRDSIVNTQDTVEDQKEIDKILKEENIVALEEEQLSNLTYLDVLTGQPHPDDILLHCVPVIAPWNTLQKYKFKLKILPGSQKRGKAAKQATQTFLSITKKLAREHDLIKAVPENEWIDAMMQKVKLVTSK